MLKYILVVVAICWVELPSSAQTMCLGVNCEPVDPLSNWNPFEDDPFGEDFRQRFPNLNLDDDRQECIRTCHSEYFERLFDCTEVYDSSLSPLRDGDLSACVDWAERQRSRCLVPIIDCD